MRKREKSFAKAIGPCGRMEIGLLAIVAMVLLADVPVRGERVNGTILVSSQYNFRGVTQNDRGVIQPQVDLSIPFAGRKSVDFAVWGNIDMTNDTGRGVLADGNGGHLSEVDFIGSITRDIGGGEVSAGITSYNFPNGGSSTSELFLTAGGEVYGMNPSVTVAYDFDLVDGVYVNGALQRTQEIGSRMAASVGASLGYADRSQAEVYYGVRSSGFADLGVYASFDYLHWNNKVLGVSVHGSRLLAGDFRDAVEQSGLRSGTVWGGVTVGAGY